MISDKDRGFLLELVLTKVKFVGRGSIQIVGK
jgi:replicative superfamily II helicase